MDRSLKNKETNKRKTSLALFLFGFLSLSAFLVLLISSDVAIEYMKKGLRLCVATVIPSLFPFMIISELIVSSGVGFRISKIFSRPMRSIFGLSEGGVSAYMLGTVCGFPIGAKTAVSMYDRGMMSKCELERLLTFCNNPGSAFVISAVGVSLFGSRDVGILLYICVILSSLIIGCIGRLFFKEKETCSAKLSLSSGFEAKMITDAVQSSAVSMLTVCAYVVFFSAFVGCIGALLSQISAPSELIAVIFGFFEISGGMGAAAEVDDSVKAILLCSLFSGWSGLSVHFQIMSVCSGRDLDFKPYFLSKAVQGLITSALMGIALKFILPYMSSGGSFVFSAKHDRYSDPSLLCGIFFAASLSPFLLKLRSTEKFFGYTNSLRKSRKKMKKGIDKQDFV